MSESLETTVTRRPRSERPAREIHREEEETPGVVVESAPAEHIDPESALAESQSQLQERDRQLAQARERERASETARRAAEQQAAQARASDRQSVVSTLLDAAKSEQNSARAAVRSAREAGDLDAETAAFEALSSSTQRITQATAELEYLKQHPVREQQAPQQQQSGATPEVQRWWDEHPRYFADEDYRAAAEGLHGSALRAHKREGSQEYVDFIDAGLTRVFGEGHGQTGGGRQQQRPRQEQQMRGDGVPPSRGNGAGTAGWKQIKTPLGDLMYQDRADGTRGVRFANRDTQENFMEGARMDRGYDKDPKRTLAEYTNEHITAALEGYPDLKVGDGRSFE